MKKSILILFALISLTAFSQRNSETVKDKDLYGSDTKWSCADKHFGYFYVNYSKPIPINNSNIEKSLCSNIFSAGYTYRFKVAKPFDIGAEIAFQKRTSSIKKDDLPTFDPSMFYDKISSFHNYASGGIYFRFNLSGATYRNLGYYIDLGGLYSYAFTYGMKYRMDNEFLNQKLKFKKPEYLSPFEYSLFLRVGLSNFALIASWHIDDWINDFKPENLNFKRNPLTVGVQLNLYSK
jgi:hypothetical protein